MRKRLALPVVALAVAGLVTGFATVANASPSQSSRCSSCHPASGSVTVAATPVSNDGVNAVYTIAVNNPFGANGWAVFGASKLAGGSGGGGTITVPVGATYTVYGVSAGTGNGYASTTLSPAANGGSGGGGTVTPTPPTPPTTGVTEVETTTFTYRFKLGRRGNKGLTAVLTNQTTGAKYLAKVDKKGRVVFRNVPEGTYRLSVKVKGKKFKFKARTVSVG